MAELRDVYSLEFNSSQFQSEVTSAISRIEELNTAMAEGADVAGELEEAQGNLVSILGAEAKGIEQLNQKRNVLVGTSKQLNAESKAGVIVGKQLDTTNKQIAVSTGNAAKAQKGFGASLLDGVKNISKMRRVASTLTFVFRAITAAIPFGLILSFAGPILSFFGNMFKSVDNTAENMEKLNDTTLTLKERLNIAAEELEKLNNIEGKRGKLTDEEKKRRQELVKVYQETSAQIIKEEQDRYDKIADLQIRSNRLAIKLRGESIQSVKDNLENERQAIILQGKKSDLEYSIQIKEAQQKERELRAAGQDAIADDYYKKWQLLTDEQLKTWELQTLEILTIEQDAQKKIIELIDKAQKEKERKEKEFRDNLNKIIDKADATTVKGIKKVTNEALAALDRRKKAEEDYQKMLDDSIKKQRDSINELKAELETDSGIDINNKERELAVQLLFLEQQRNEALNAFRGNTEEQAKIDEAFNKKRTELETKANQEIIMLRIDLLKKLRNVARSQGDEAVLADIDKQISDLELKFEELNKVTSEGVEQTKDKYKELADQAGQAIQLASDTVFNVLNAQVTSYIDNLDRAIDKSKTALDDIRQNSENFNARQLELEKERLERLEAERVRAVEREKNLGQIQVAINAAIAISKAAAEGGGFASAFTIAATLASLIAGLAQARAAAGNAFYDGVEYLNRGNNPRGRDTIPAMLNEGERVITTDTNAKYWDVLSAVHNNRIPADVLNSFASAYQQGGLKAALGAFGDNISLSNELGQKSVFVNVAHNNSGLENRLERIESVLMELPKYMPKTTVSANAKGIFRIVEQRQQRKDYSRNWAK
jgi:hypothetical protein